MNTPNKEAERVNSLAFLVNISIALEPSYKTSTLTNILTQTEQY